ncbi:MAG: Rpn family recombination-promoting nuclease/putative transposase [Defluviitaleaceae bacterium]|nr:Rpn family recombination-promoting nuclease/putative transposase [Defluviitaleaceae bacterium]
MSILDIKLNTTRGIINVEIQLNKYTDMEDRIIFGISKSITNQKHSGNNYKLKKVVTILITDYFLIEDHEQYHDTFKYHSSKTGYTFSSSTEIHTLELPKLPDDNDNSNLWYWLKFIKSEKEEDFEMLVEQKPLIKKAYGVLKELSQDEQTRLLAEAREALEWDKVAIARNSKAEGLREGIVQGIEKGEEQKAINIAKNALKMNLSLEQISILTGLSIYEIEQLQNEK